VKAVSVNITVLNSPGGGAMTAYANTDTRPATTTLSMLAGSAAVANAAVVTLGTDGKLAVWANSATDVIIDVNGWYTNLADTYTYTYTYGADGLRATKTGPAGVTTFTWDRSGPLPQLVAETSPAGTIRYLYGPDGTPFEQINADGTTWYLHHDQLGSTRTITDATGTTIATTTYDPYGKPTATTGTATTRLGYTGQYTDPETGLQYLRNRYYDPATASFLTRDPLNATTRSAYGYTGGNPLNHVDPSGLCSNDWYYIFESACSYTPEEKLTRQVNALNKKLEAIDTKLAQKLLLSQADKDVLGQFSKGVPLALATLNCLNWHSQTVEGCAKDLLDGLASFVLIPGYGALWSLVRNLMDFVENTFVYVGNVLNSGESAMGTSCPEGIPA
jgi:RHS repeat-associated protein